MDLEKKEKEAMIADTFWGMEVYSIAFVILLCCCLVCYLQKTKCCGYLKPAKQEFGYAAYGQRGGFKQVFGGVDDAENSSDDDDNDYQKNSINDDRDPEMGDAQNDSEEMLNS